MHRALSTSCAGYPLNIWLEEIWAAWSQRPRYGTVLQDDFSKVPAANNLKT